MSKDTNRRQPRWWNCHCAQGRCYQFWRIFPLNQTTIMFNSTAIWLIRICFILVSFTVMPRYANDNKDVRMCLQKFWYQHIQSKQRIWCQFYEFDQWNIFEMLIIYFDRVLFSLHLSLSLFFMLLVGCVLKTQWYIISIYIWFFALWNFKKFSRNKRTINKYNNKTIRTRKQKSNNNKKHTHVSTNLQSKKCYALWCWSIIKCIL